MGEFRNTKRIEDMRNSIGQRRIQVDQIERPISLINNIIWSFGDVNLVIWYFGTCPVTKVPPDALLLSTSLGGNGVFSDCPKMSEISLETSWALAAAVAREDPTSSAG